MPKKNPRKPKRDGSRHKIGPEGAVPEGRGATVQLKDGSEVALYNIGGKLHAIENFCPHKGFPLADSRIYGGMVECDLHGYRFDVSTGACVTKSSCSIDAYDVVVEDGWIYIVT
ncbi:MAG: Rieske (2Fe-2S) protein [Pyrinomonadaceae bacterium]|nr:Rieske (2Fe-2S) protein [Pyrinomonadaceae bacterium]